MDPAEVAQTYIWMMIWTSVCRASMRSSRDRKTKSCCCCWIGRRQKKMKSWNIACGSCVATFRYFVPSTVGPSTCKPSLDISSISRARYRNRTSNASSYAASHDKVSSCSAFKSFSIFLFVFLLRLSSSHHHDVLKSKRKFSELTKYFRETRKTFKWQI